MVDNAGASVSARRGACGCAPGSHAYGWRDAMDVIVRWRQLAEPNDQVRHAEYVTFGFALTCVGACGKALPSPSEARLT